MAQPTNKKQSFFRRLSFSHSTQPKVTAKVERTLPSGRAGPAYEQLVPARKAAGTAVENPPPTTFKSPERNPIYPALASPTKPPRPERLSRYADADESASLIRSPASYQGISEARAYAQAVKARDPVGRDGATSAPPQSPKRPLPKPPVKAKPDTSFIDFTRSPTLPPLVDPRGQTVDRWAPLSRKDLPTRSSSVSYGKPAAVSSSRRIVTSPLMVSQPERRKRDFLAILSVPQIQATMLPFISINTFLSMTGASEALRKQFTGEIVGKWVMKEWGIQLEKERGRSWPNLTVWEGFLESLLHDPATYNTYPRQWHNLLRHLSLSHTLIVLHLRSLPASAFPTALLPFEEEFTRSRVNSDAGSIARSVMPKKEHLVEIVMPEPLAARRGSVSQKSATISHGKTLPPVSYPAPKRYNFSNNRKSKSDTSRPGSVFSVQSSPSIALSQWRPVEPARRYDSPLRRESKLEPAFDKPPPFAHGRAPILRVFVTDVQWPSAQGAAAAVAELNKCGATRRMQLGDLVVNTACRPKTTEHVLVFVPFVSHLLVPLEYELASTGHLPSYLDAFTIPPSYYYPFLPSTIVFLDFRPYARRAARTIRLAYDRRDVTVASGARMSAKRYLYVAGFEITAEDPAAPEWRGMVSMETDGTEEGKARLLQRLQGMGPWEIVREKSMTGVWLRMI